LRNSLDLARHAEQWGYHRFWLAEHHNIPGIASAATSVAVGYIAGGTKTIRVGAGGVMLPNHAPLIVAEQFGTLESLYPGRIDLGLGRAPGTDRDTLQALRRSPEATQTFLSDVLELQSLFDVPHPDQTVRAVPGAGLKVPLWILGSSLFGARVAATLGLPFAFAAHFAPDLLAPALETYRSQFEPSAQLSQPFVMVAVNVVAAETCEEAQYLFTTSQQACADIIRGTPEKLRPPIADIESYWSPSEKEKVSHMLACTYVGSPDVVRDALWSFIAETGADEVLVNSNLFDHCARLRSYEILAQAYMKEK
jgi:luciferase family oxidoreductase group 1